MSLESKAELLMAILDYDCEEKHILEKGVDFVASDDRSEERVLLRVIIESKTKSGIVGVDAVPRVVEAMARVDLLEITVGQAQAPSL